MKHARKPCIHLTGRQQEILDLIWDGLTSKEIGAQLGISFRTVEVYRATLMEVLGVSNVAQLLKSALHTGLLKAPR